MIDVAYLLHNGGIGAVLLRPVLVTLEAGASSSSSAVSTGALELGAALEQELAQDAEGVGGPVVG